MDLSHTDMAVSFFRHEADKAYTIATRIHTSGKSHHFWLRERRRALRMVERIKQDDK